MSPCKSMMSSNFLHTRRCDFTGPQKLASDRTAPTRSSHGSPVFPTGLQSAKSADSVIAVFNDENYGMNFNGYAKGGATYTIPKDWTVNVTFINPSPVPHSLIVIEKDSLKKLQVPEPYFKGGAVPEHLKGLSYAKSSFSFTADEAGDYALACGFPAHAMNGHWIALEVSSDAKAPTLKLGGGEAKPASPALPPK